MMRQCGLCVSILRGKFTGGGSHDQTVRLWDVQTHQCLRVLRGHKDAVRAIAFDADDQRLASGNCDQTIRLWEVQIGEGLRVLPGHTGGIFTLNHAASYRFDRTNPVLRSRSNGVAALRRGGRAQRHERHAAQLAGEPLSAGGSGSLRSGKRGNLRLRRIPSLSRPVLASGAERREHRRSDRIYGVPQSVLGPDRLGVGFHDQDPDVCSFMRSRLYGH